MNILIAEDDAVSSYFLRLLLEGMGHIVTACADGRQAWEAYKHGEYPVIISDWMMPEMSGLELCKAVRGLCRHPRCYFVMATAKSTEVDTLEALAAGADGYIVKPIHKKDIEAHLEVVLKRDGGPGTRP